MQGQTWVRYGTVLAHPSTRSKLHLSNANTEGWTYFLYYNPNSLTMKASRMQAQGPRVLTPRGLACLWAGDKSSSENLWGFFFPPPIQWNWVWFANWSTRNSWMDLRLEVFLGSRAVLELVSIKRSPESGWEMGGGISLRHRLMNSLLFADSPLHTVV